MHKHFTITIRGNIQHKGYKLRTMILANKYDIKGSVAEEDHKIIIDAEGGEDNLEAFFNSVIDNHKDIDKHEFRIEKVAGSLTYFDDFRIL